MTWRREKSCPYRDSNSDLSAFQPIANRFTDCAISAPTDCCIVFLFRCRCLAVGLHTTISWQLSRPQGVIHNSLPLVYVFVLYLPIVSRQRLSTDVTAATNAHPTLREFLDASSCMRSVSYQRKVGD
jgi:hypothetical protein